MSKERLEEIKQYYSRMESMPWDTQEDIRFLIEQAERVQELENVNRVLKKANVGSERAKERLREWVDELEMENECYREAIERALGESGWGDERNDLYRMIGILTNALENC